MRVKQESSQYEILKCERKFKPQQFLQSQKLNKIMQIAFQNDVQGFPNAIKAMINHNPTGQISQI